MSSSSGQLAKTPKPHIFSFYFFWKKNVRKTYQDQDEETPFQEALRLDASFSNKDSEINLEEGGLWKYLYLVPDQDWMPWEMDVPIPVKVLYFGRWMYL